MDSNTTKNKSQNQMFLSFFKEMSKAMNAPVRKNSFVNRKEAAPNPL
jgi:hypothetical protein